MAGTDDGQSADAHSASVQDYVKVIYGLTEWRCAPVTPVRIAKRLSVANSSVTGMLTKLVRLGLVDYVAYKPVLLTPEGRTLALTMVRRHRLLETFLVQDLGYTWDEVHAEAEMLEHTVSDRFIEELDKRLHRPRRDPHGDPIPSHDGTIVLPQAHPLSELDDGHPGHLVRVSDENPALLRFLTTEGVSLDTPVKVLERNQFGGSMRVGFGESPNVTVLNAGDEMADALWIHSTDTHIGCNLV
ncbi:metal-dependent transcriptional regulator [Arthrobacter roseus]|uniref:metal-dependent transcriptional regulator n=1 Tax=Arthrobacter roseus TaxID=136274 RepID=UPI001965F3C0|nr:metal-dependent transcriptional regulator [Arthrobacter roseus]MBM7849064.1 DtxR family Mn-dependent transcriptional regulator [Arthrobacter roseus]